MKNRLVRSRALMCVALAAVVFMGSMGCKKKEVITVIGGYGWMANFMDQDGYVASGGVYKKLSQDWKLVPVETQYNFENTLSNQSAEWVSYEAVSPDPKPFDCGVCHATGYTAKGQPAAEGYAGTGSCLVECHSKEHQKIFESFPETGHPHALAAVNGKAPDMPFTEIPGAPETFSFGTTNTYDLTGLPGINGQWIEPGVGCEACHGPALAHTDNSQDLTKRPLPAAARQACSKCHVTGTMENGVVTADGDIETDGNLIKSHQEWEEWLASPHSNPGNLDDPAYPGCVACHDPHASTIFDDTAAGTGRKIYTDADCLTCHTGKTVGISQMATAGVMCIDCHMPYAGKAAILHSVVGEEGNYVYSGDIRSHQFRVKIDGKKNSIIDVATKNVILEQGKTQGITLDLVCQPCHSDSGLQPHNLPAAKKMYLSELQENAPLVHP